MVTKKPNITSVKLMWYCTYSLCMETEDVNESFIESQKDAIKHAEENKHIVLFGSMQTIIPKLETVSLRCSCGHWIHDHNTNSMKCFGIDAGDLLCGCTKFNVKDTDSKFVSA